MREAVRERFGVGEAHALQPFDRLVFGGEGGVRSLALRAFGGGRARLAACPDHFLNLRSHRHHGIEGRGGFLKDERDARAAKAAHLALG